LGAASGIVSFLQLCLSGGWGGFLGAIGPRLAGARHHAGAGLVEDAGELAEALAAMLREALLAEEPEGAAAPGGLQELALAGLVALRRASQLLLLASHDAPHAVEVRLILQFLAGGEPLVCAALLLLALHRGDPAVEVAEELRGPPPLDGGAGRADLRLLLAVGHEPFEARQAETETPHD
jgi:hypothetical protein